MTAEVLVAGLVRVFAWVRGRPLWLRIALAVLVAVALAWLLRSALAGFGAFFTALAGGGVGRRAAPQPAPQIEEARQLGEAQGRVAEVADNLHGQAADLRRVEARAEERDAERDAAREARADAAAAAVPEAHPPGWARPPGYDR
jgi:hypothetical protein